MTVAWARIQVSGLWIHARLTRGARRRLELRIESDIDSGSGGVTGRVCTQPGTAYPQVITPGYRVLVEGAGQTYNVRAAGQRGRICYTPESSGVACPADTA